MRVKICGITRVEDAKAALDAGADAIGLVFAKSPRRVSAKQAEKICKAVGPWVSVVGVFVNEKSSVISQLALDCGLDVVQLHGEEPPAFIKSIGGVKIIKAFRVENKADLKQVARYNTDAFLFDTKVSGLYGGSGKSFDWNVLKSARFSKPWILSGGLSVKNVRQALKSLNPYGVDVSSGVEKAPGIKDAKLIKEFISCVKKDS